MDWEVLEAIPSWVQRAECEYLCSFVQPGMTAIEVGAGRGRTAIAMAQAGAKVWGVSSWSDPLQGTRLECEANIKKAGVKVKLAGMDSLVFAHTVLSWIEADVIFIDADHTYEAVRADAYACARLLKAGGVILFHDVGGNFPGVDRLVSELPWERIGQVLNTVAFRVAP